jgi:hypothetical protein
VMDSVNWHLVEAVGTWAAAVGTIGATGVALGLAGLEERRRKKRDAHTRWCKLYLLLIELQAALEIAEEVRRGYMKLYTSSPDGKPPPNVGLAEELKMSREETRARVAALHARDAVMELLLGAERMTASERQRVLAVAVAWDPRLLTQEIETRKRINLINELLREVILPRADSEVVRALDAIENDR